MYNLLLFVLFISPLSLINAHADEFFITEKSLLDLTQKSNPSLNEIEASFLQSKVQQKELEDKFGYEAYSGIQHEGTKEKAFISFWPVFSTINQYKLGVKKYTKYGVVLDIGRSVDIRSAQKNYSEITTIVDQFSIRMDLWKDFMGSVTKAKFDNISDLQKKDQLQEKISKAVLSNNMRRLYWGLVGNSEKIKITNRLYEAAKKQAKDARKRKANSISDKAEVARFQSLVHQRKGAILSLKYQREVLYKTLRDFLPDLVGKELVLVDYNIAKANFDVVSCSAKIGSQKDIPYEHTQYDEITSLLRTIKTRQLKVDNSYDKIDVSFNLAVKRTGVASETVDNKNYEGDFSRASSDLSDNDRSGMSAGLLVTIPFGENKKDTTRVKELLSEKQFSASINRLDTNVKSTHEQVKQTVQLLARVIQEQKANSLQLKLRVKEMKKKYAQARIPEYALIQDENDLLQSDLTIVDTQLLVVNTILDYLSVFNNYPCAFNAVLNNKKKG